MEESFNFMEGRKRGPGREVACPRSHKASMAGLRPELQTLAPFECIEKSIRQDFSTEQRHRDNESDRQKTLLKRLTQGTGPHTTDAAPFVTLERLRSRAGKRLSLFSLQVS